MLKVEELNVYYGNIQALKGVSLEIHQGEIVTLIGANGAGKSTLLKAISGLLKPKQGSITYMDQPIGGKAAQTIVKQGISHVPEGRRVFANMTVEENLELGAFLRKDKDGIRQDFERVYELFPRLLERRKQLSGTLSGGEQQMLAMGRALMARPKLLLLDEPSMGLAPLLVKTIFRIIEEINQTGTTILLVEQNANMALSIANRAYVIETGRVVLSGTASELNESDQIKMAYLGGH
ncbi:ABC transporter ATP-binding protein [Aneurinibacillus aneurinilyticus]|jgi:branched-chain amino acid transport system ATP-binding protein|uniref:ABC transporter ATP-binding protein n=2 Tax=Aneurinibacillus aneurinilyticus TaxID=1391 RepID=A0A848CRF2_ANEAE|nr:ABC transporter ATP-binding protein [Aneurinibacillus aneurinilyticus]ERI08690.1 ABC transporter, ATP-binding protein [Aneurinibacillus aneurinilyticus ATCC 12856]MCI1694037.1 ABC transporter ATP-binding protein [Aneurinibacillus aneurinilyticus]MED0671287.1 ABC transporter ATP-binding protein [Aneurinibacillus aneurinilyticus]MED0708484.1 ABC transporter ATP-binding protein [Aneurinibacillus aneurinilyticus]MED0723196.1 ABC transporter ATP-binding protein [Aneurinibacillus aneurinilyticus]